MHYSDLDGKLRLLNKESIESPGSRLMKITHNVVGIKEKRNQKYVAKDGPSKTATFYRPLSLDTLYKTGDIVVADWGAVRKISADLSIVSTLYRPQCQLPLYMGIRSLCVGKNDTVFFSLGYAMMQMPSLGEAPFLFAGSLTETGNKDGLLLTARFLEIRYIAYDPSRNELILLEYLPFHNGCNYITSIKIISLTGEGQVFTLTQSKNRGPELLDQVEEGCINRPSSIMPYMDGYLVMDDFNFCIHYLSRDGGQMPYSWFKCAFEEPPMQWMMGMNLVHDPITDDFYCSSYSNIHQLCYICPRKEMASFIYLFLPVRGLTMIIANYAAEIQLQSSSTLKDFKEVYGMKLNPLTRQLYIFDDARRSLSMVALLVIT